ncbi:MAG: hypothetical protein IJS58_08570 [Bacilli bacterium]|nr:hypothetical protein [Bacilli bacterium]
MHIKKTLVETFIKIFILLFVFFNLLFNIKIYANNNYPDIITSINNPIEDIDLNIEGYDIYSSNINYQKVGCYNIIYRNHNDLNDEITRKVYVMNNNLNINNSDVYELDYSRVERVEELELKENVYLYLIDEKIGLSSRLNIIIYNNGIYNSRKINYGKYKACFKDDKNAYIYYYESDLYLKMLSLSLEYLIYKDPISIDYNFSNLYFEKNQNSQDDILYLMNTNNIRAIKFSNNKQLKEINLLDELAIINNKSYSGYVNIDSKYYIDHFIYLFKKDKTYLIINIDKNLSIISDKEIELKYDKQKYKQNDELASVIFIYEINNEIDINYEKGIINYQILYKDLYSLDFNEYLNNIEITKSIKNISVHNYNDLINLEIIDEDDKSYNYLLYQDKVFEDNDNKIKKYDILSNHAFIIDSEVHVYDLDDFLIFYYKYDKLEKDRIFAFHNGKRIDEKIIGELDYSYSLYGDYEKTLKTNITVNNHNYLINLKYNYYINDDANVNNNQIYQLGYHLYFIGEAYLNDDLIESGYVIDEEGKYVLTIQGTNQKKIINFEVRELNEEESEAKGREEKIIDFFINKNDLQEVVNVKMVNDVKNEINNIRLIYIGIIFCLTLLIVIFTNFLLNMKYNKKGD